MIGKIALGVAVVIGGIAVAAAFQPDAFRVERSVIITAQPAIVNAQIDDLRAFNAWSPWGKLDPDATVTFDGPPRGIGAKMSWDGNMQVGKGSVTVSEMVPDQMVKYAMVIEKPIASTSTAEFKLEKVDAGATKVTWTMYGQNNYMGKVMNLFMDCETRLGDSFEEGLGDLKLKLEPLLQ